MPDRRAAPIDTAISASSVASRDDADSGWPTDAARGNAPNALAPPSTAGQADEAADDREQREDDERHRHRRPATRARARTCRWSPRNSPRNVRKQARTCRRPSARRDHGQRPQHVGSPTRTWQRGSRPSRRTREAGTPAIASVPTRKVTERHRHVRPQPAHLADVLLAAAGRGSRCPRRGRAAP